MTLAYANQLGFRTQKTDVGAQKIEGSLLTTYRMVIAAFLMIDTLDRVRFF